MKFLILGGNRFVGKILAEMLIFQNKKNTVDVFNRSGTGPWVANKIKGNRNYKKDLEKIDFNKYDCVIDFCLYNKTQAEEILPLIENSSIEQYIFISSMDSIFKIYKDYGEDKAKVEKYIKKFTIPWVILRPTYILGINNPHYREEYYFDKIQKTQTISIDGNGDHLLTFISAEDIARFICKIIKDRVIHQVYNLCNDDKTNLIEFVNMFFKITGKKTKIKFDSDKGPFLNEDFFLSNTKAKTQHNFNFTPLKKILREYYEWYN